MKHQTIMRAQKIAADFRGTVAAKGIRASVNGDRGELLIYEDIGASYWSDSGVTAKDVMDQLATLRGVKGLDVRFSCFGGDVFEGKAIYEALMRFDCEDKVAHVDSIAASAASFIAMACDKIVMSPASTMMIHCAWSFAMGNASDLRATADILSLEDGNIAGIYAAKTKKPLQECLDLMAAETWMDAAKALELGFADEIARKDEDDDEEEADEEETKKASNVVRLVATTQQRINVAARARLAAIANSIEKNRASPVKERAGQPARK